MIVQIMEFYRKWP